ncbi:LOW QUALITY PROTEIN: possible tetrapyrrole methyltransferase domain [Geomicrobium sp. JCM 19037]|nr:LOW QUALITY PROTEIN: possible tetrapyrrole methyltransferase domain [Geomicrobium sp. JCM 19037]
MSLAKFPTICVFGLGAGTLDQMTLSTYRQLQETDLLYLRTKAHPVVRELQDLHIQMESFDHIYESHETFGPVYEAIAEQLIEKAKDTPEKTVFYAVPGHPLVAEETVQRLIDAERKGEIILTIVGGQSFLDPVFNALRIDPSEGMQLLDGTQFRGRDWQVTNHLIVTQVYDSISASNVKLELMEQVPDDYIVKVVVSAGNDDESVKEIPLYTLDHDFEMTNLAVVYVPPISDLEERYHTFQTLRDVIATLRGPGGCPWDQKQTHTSLKKYLLEETYEVLEAIDEEDDDHLVEELGDVLLQVMLHSQIGEDEGYFSVDDVIRTLTEKMIRRHPHVFHVDSHSENITSEQVVSNWEQIKQREKETDQKLLDGIPTSMPAIMMSYELQKKSGQSGFTWREAEPMWEKLQEEIQEWQEALAQGSDTESKKELGDVLFIIVNLARFYKLQPEEALLMTNHKFKSRFSYIEDRLKEENKTPNDSNLEEMDALWNEAKTREDQT